jgi:predicted Rossmann fold flavoprotein
MKIVIVGGGPSGIMASIRIKELHPDYQVTLLEKGENIGQRIKISGNGRCNFSNANFGPSKYNHPEFIVGYENELNTFKKYLKETGFYYFSDEEGRMYPHSETSTSFLYVLKNLLNKYRVEVKTSSFVTKIKKENDGFIILTNNETYYADKVVICIGGVSLNNNIDDYKNLLLPIVSSLTPLTSSLTPISTSSFSKKMEGRRVRSNVRLLCNGECVKEEKGEVLFKKNGVSGIVIFNMSSYLARKHLSSYSSYQISIDMLPDLSYKELNDFKKIDPSLKNLLQEDIAEEIIKNHRDPKNFILDVVSLYDLKNSQVTSGGVSINKLNSSLSLKDEPNIYLGGEVIDIDGECGGYNIEWALLSGIRIGNNV